MLADALALREEERAALLTAARPHLVPETFAGDTPLLPTPAPTPLTQAEANWPLLPVVPESVAPVGPLSCTVTLAPDTAASVPSAAPSPSESRRTVTRTRRSFLPLRRRVSCVMSQT